MTDTAPLGFIGLGPMGEAMAMNLVKAQIPLVVWNRTHAKTQSLAAAGAQVAERVEDVFDQCETVFLMLANDVAINDVLARGTAEFAQRVRSRLLINTSTVQPAYSQALEADIRAAGGRYVEAPVSGSRKPAEEGRLVAMLAGANDDIERAVSLIAPMCHTHVFCGAVPGALLMKLAVNLYLITMVTGLAESAHFAQRHGLDLDKFAEILNAGPMASDVSRVKIGKLLSRDFSRQAGISDVLKNNRLVADAARAADIASPLLDACLALYTETDASGFGGEDMAAVIRAIEHRSDRMREATPRHRDVD